MSAREWRTIKIGELGRVVTGKTPPTQDVRNFGDKYPFITPRDMSSQKKIRYTERYLSEKGGCCILQSTAHGPLQKKAAMLIYQRPRQGKFSRNGLPFTQRIRNKGQQKNRILTMKHLLDKPGHMPQFH